MLFSFFLKMLRESRQEVVDRERNKEKVYDLDSDSKVPQEQDVESAYAEAPEEAETPMPCSFTAPLAYFSITRDEALSEYIQLLETHVSQEMKEECRQMLEYLSGECLAAFVPE
jgi:hypothetical protein